MQNVRPDIFNKFGPVWQFGGDVEIGAALNGLQCLDALGDITDDTV